MEDEEELSAKVRRIGGGFRNLSLWRARRHECRMMRSAAVDMVVSDQKIGDVESNEETKTSLRNQDAR